MKDVPVTILFQIIAMIIYSLAYYFFTGILTMQPILNTLLFVVGMGVGAGILLVDSQWFYKYYSDSKADAGYSNLITRSLLFVIALLPLSIYMITSTGSAMGVGVLLGILVSLSIEMFMLRNNSDSFKQQFLFQLKRTITNKDIDWYTTGFISFTLVISALVVF